jgi:hypothetical protein
MKSKRSCALLRSITLISWCIGHKGHSRIWRFHMGSTAAKIAEHTRTTLLIVQ